MMEIKTTGKFIEDLFRAFEKGVKECPDITLLDFKKWLEKENYYELDKKWVAIDDVKLKLRELKSILINNSNCDCSLMTTKYADIVDLIFNKEELKEAQNE